MSGQRKDFFSRLAGRLKDRHQLNTPVQGSFLERPQWKMEVVMATFTHPTKQVVRSYLNRRLRDPKPPPSPEEIRRQLGWSMAPSECKMAQSRS